MESEAHLYVPKLQGWLGAVDDVEGVGHRWAEEGLGAERAGDRTERAERAKRWAERCEAERAGDMAKASMSLNEDMDVVFFESLWLTKAATREVKLEVKSLSVGTGMVEAGQGRGEGRSVFPDGS